MHATYNINLQADVHAPFVCILYGGLRIFPGRKVLTKFPWRHRSDKSTRSPTIFPATSSTKIGVIVSKVTTILDGSVSACVEFMYC